jgi:hypothetical protein
LPSCVAVTIATFIIETEHKASVYSRQMMRNALRVRENVLMVDNVWLSHAGVILSLTAQMGPMRKTAVSVHKLRVMLLRIIV